MTSLRLAPSSPGRMAALLTRLESFACWLTMYPDSPVDCHRTAQELTLRGWRLMLRWYAAGVEIAWQCPHNPENAGEWQMAVNWHGEHWAYRYDYQRLPDDWRDRLRRELAE